MCTKQTVQSALKIPLQIAVSSLLSKQSDTASQTFVFGMHCPFEHIKAFSGQTSPTR